MFSGDNILKTSIFFTVLLTWVIAYDEWSGDKTINLKIGFDISRGRNGAPSLRIRDFEDSDFRPRAFEDEASSEKTVTGNSPAVRADSFSDSDESDSKDRKPKAESSGDDKGNDQSDDDNDSDDSDGGNRMKSTKGLNPQEYEPEDNPKIHGRYQDDDSDGYRRRDKREARKRMTKRKTKKVMNARKQGITRPVQRTVIV